jgi:hypothetical protein
MTTTAEKIRERRLDRMRLGQAACDYVALPSDPEVRLAIVPLTEAEYLQALEAVTKTGLPDDMAGAAVKDRVQAQEILVRSFREEKQLSERVFNSVPEMMETLETQDIDHAIDCYHELVEKSSPVLDGLPKEEFENLKKTLQTMDWNDLSGSAWYAARRFLSRIIPSPLLDNSPGSGSTKQSITTSD